MSNTKITGSVDMTSLRSGGHMLLELVELQNYLHLNNAHLNGGIRIKESSIKGQLVLDGATLGGSFHVVQKTKLFDIQMLGSKISGSLNVLETNVDRTVELQSVTLFGNNFIRDSTFSKRVSIIDSTINGSLVISKSQFSSVDLGGTTIQGELQMGESGRPNVWNEQSILNCRNLKTGGLSDGGPDSWPPRIDLDGFQYSILGQGARGENADHDIADREPAWFSKWLKKQSPYSYQPYFQLSQVFYKMGYNDRANDVLYAANSLERDMAWQNGSFFKWRWLGLSLLDWTIGYGYGTKYFRSLLWVIG